MREKPAVLGGIPQIYKAKGTNYVHNCVLFAFKLRLFAFICGRVSKGGSFLPIQIQNICDETERIMKSAIERFNQADVYLLINDLSERCICSRLAFHIQQKLLELPDFKEYTVDVEYNRGSNSLEMVPKCLHSKKIVVDLIVHKRGFSEIEGFINLFCVELKKSTNRNGYSKDKQRLQDMVAPQYGFCYKAGYMVVADMRNHRLDIEEKYFAYR